MKFEDFEKNIEKPIYKDYEELFNQADLHESEKAIFRKYINYCGWWLLRVKSFYLSSFNNKTSTIKLIARGLINLNHPRVTGRIVGFIKEMFGDKKMHRVYKTKNGIRSTQKSPKIETALFELDVLSFFLKNEFYIEICGNKNTGKKIPEFVATKDEIRIHVETKFLNFDSILDNCHGNHFITGFNQRQKQVDFQTGLEKNKQILERNYKNAIKKIADLPTEDYYLIFICLHDFFYFGNLIGEFVNESMNSWEDNKHKFFLGLVIIGGKTMLIKNSKCNIDMELIGSEINKFQDYELNVVL